MPSHVIAIDGPAGAGKSTTAKAVAAELGFTHLDSGALYRAVTLAALDAGVPFTGQTIVSLARSLPVRLAYDGGTFRPEVSGVDVSREVRAERVTRRVSEVAAMPLVRLLVDDTLRGAAGLAVRGVVLDGRDIGTVVFPDAELKVFLTATAAERALRRARQDGMSEEPRDLEQLTTELSRRDDADSSRAVAPLTAAKDAVVLDTTGMAFEEQVAEIVRLARKVF